MEGGGILSSVSKSKNLRSQAETQRTPLVTESKVASTCKCKLKECFVYNSGSETYQSHLSFTNLTSILFAFDRLRSSPHAMNFVHLPQQYLCLPYVRLKLFQISLSQSLFRTLAVCYLNPCMHTL